ncbi:MAG: hypothetical protein K2Y18_01990 [Alphaproteobacteria bacterium]|jgi:hypothetical protein|nr:hypothetical protein [Alphaproteobacteria bacterium]
MLKKFGALLLSFSLVISIVQATEKEKDTRRRFFGRSQGSENPKKDDKLKELMSPSDKRGSADSKGPTSFSQLGGGRRKSDPALSVGDSLSKPSYIMDPEALAALVADSKGGVDAQKEVRLRKTPNDDARRRKSGSSSSPLDQLGRRKSGNLGNQDKLSTGLGRSTSGSLQSNGPNSPHKSPRTPGGSSRSSPRDTISPRVSKGSTSEATSPRAEDLKLAQMENSK